MRGCAAREITRRGAQCAPAFAVDINHDPGRKRTMNTKLEQEEYLYRRAIDIIESPDTDQDKENLLFQEVWLPLAELYKDRLVVPSGGDDG
jgi:hypothetical protein